MILRKSDWGLPGHEGAIIHYATANQSFLKLAYIHREMKIEHWYCCLALVNPDLEYVDPHDPTLDIETKAAIVVELFVNPWYFFREYVRIPQDGADPTKFKIHRGSFALIWTFFNNIDIALLLIRQQGKTVAVAALLVYLMRILKGSRTILLTKDSTLRTETISKMKLIRDALPAYGWNSVNDADNTEIFTYNSRGNRLVTCIAQNSKEAALGAGRGLTTARLFSDETAFTKFIRIMLPAALAAGTTARRIAEEAGIPYGNVFTTTPGKRDEEDGKMVYKMFHDGYYWDEHLLDIPTRGELIDLITKASKGDRVLIHAPFTHRQLGMTDVDLYKAIANAGGTREEQERDFGLKWTAGSLSSPLSVTESETIRGSVISPAKHIEVFPNNYTLKWYYDRNEMSHKLAKKHIIGLDTSDAVGRDGIALAMIHSETLGLAASGLVNESNLVVFSNWLTDILVKYPETILVIERKSSAPTIIDSLLLALPARGIEPSRRIFNRIVQDRDSDDLDLKEFRRSATPRSEAFYETYRKHFGFNTTGTSRKLLYGEVLQTAVRMAGDKVHDRQLADELLGLVVKDGRVDHKASGNDDMVVAWLLACWFMLFGKRLDYYGVSNRILMRRQLVDPNEAEFDEAEFEREQAEQDALTERIDELCSKIGKNRNPFIKSTLDRELRVLLSELKLDTTQAATVGELQELIRNERLQSRYLK